MKPVLYGGLVARLRRVPGVVHAVTGLGYLFVSGGPLAWLQRQLVLGLYRLSLGHPNARAILSECPPGRIMSRTTEGRTRMWGDCINNG